MNEIIQQPKARIRLFVLILFVSSVPFWLAGFVLGRLPLPVNLPVSALVAFNPMVIALILVYRSEGWEGVKTLLGRAFDFRRIQPRIWLVPTLLFMPLVMIAEYGLMRLSGVDLPDAQITISAVLGFFAVFFVTAVGEELGWQGYVFEPLQARWNALAAALVVGFIWAIWHSIPYIQTQNTPAWIVWQSAVTVGLRVVMVWIYNHIRRTVLAAVLFHAMINVSNFLFPRYGSHYDPFIAAVIIWIVVGGIVFVSGARTLAGKV